MPNVSLSMIAPSHRSSIPPVPLSNCSVSADCNPRCNRSTCKSGNSNKASCSRNTRSAALPSERPAYAAVTHDARYALADVPLHHRTPRNQNKISRLWLIAALRRLDRYRRQHDGISSMTASDIPSNIPPNCRGATKYARINTDGDSTKSGRNQPFSGRCRTSSEEPLERVAGIEPA